MHGFHFHHLIILLIVGAAVWFLIRYIRRGLSGEDTGCALCDKENQNCRQCDKNDSQNPPEES